MHVKLQPRACLQNVQFQGVQSSHVRRIWTYGELDETQTTQKLDVLTHALTS
jgi:hypothetical protein